MKSYIKIVKSVLNNGIKKQNRTGIDTISTFGMLFEHDMNEGFPLLTTKKMPINVILVEAMGFVLGVTSKKWFQDRNCFIWDEWCNPQQLKKYDFNDLNKIVKLVIDNTPETHPSKKLLNAISIAKHQENHSFENVKKLLQLYEDDLGPIYGFQWRNFGKKYLDTVDKNVNFFDLGGIDQFQILIDKMKTNPLDRRMIVSAWNPYELVNDTYALPPCHWAFQVYSDGVYFDLMWFQRSVDVFLGLPFNIASYAFIMKLLEKETGLKPRYLKASLGDTHIYVNHIEQIKEQIEREPRNLPSFFFKGEWNGIYKFNPILNETYEIVGYNPHPPLKGVVAV